VTLATPSKVEHMAPINRPYLFRDPDSFEHSVCRSDVMTRFRSQVHLQKMILMVPPTISENLSIKFPNTLYIIPTTILMLSNLYH